MTRESKKNTWVDGASPHQSEAGCREAQAGAQDWEIWELVAAVAACILPYGTLRPGDFEATTLRPATMRPDDVEARRR